MSPPSLFKKEQDDDEEEEDDEEDEERPDYDYGVAVVVVADRWVVVLRRVSRSDRLPGWVDFVQPGSGLREVTFPGG